MKNFSVRPKTLKLLEENVGQIQDRHIAKDLVNGLKESPAAQETITDKHGLMKSIIFE